jgi:hypothetical protein
MAAAVPRVLLASDAKATPSDVRSSYPPTAEVLESLNDPSGWTEHRRGAREGVDVYKKDIAGFNVLDFAERRWWQFPVISSSICWWTSTLMPECRNGCL